MESIEEFIYENFPFGENSLTRAAIRCLTLTVKHALQSTGGNIYSEHLLYSLLTDQDRNGDDDGLDLFFAERGLSPEPFVYNLVERPQFKGLARLIQKRSSMEDDQIKSLFITNADFLEFSNGMKRISNFMSIIFDILNPSSEISATSETQQKVHKEVVPLGLKHIFSAIYIEGTTVAADVLQRVAKSKLDIHICCDQMGILATDLIIHPRYSKHRINGFSFKRFISVTQPVQNGQSPFVPDASVDFDLNKIQMADALIKGHSEEDYNWVVYPNILIGGAPRGNAARELAVMKDSNGAAIGRTTFCCLLGEYRDIDEFCERSYPFEFQNILDESANNVNELNLLFYPIGDFETTAEEPLVELVTELKRRVLMGERLVLHCRGGHGRTGMVIIPLVSALYGLSFIDAQEWVMQSYGCSKRGKAWMWRLPETSEQEALAEKVIAKVNKRKR